MAGIIADRQPSHEDHARKQSIAELIREAMNQPGLQAVFTVYNHWQQLDTFVRATDRARRPAPRVVVSHRSTPVLP